MCYGLQLRMGESFIYELFMEQANLVPRENCSSFKLFGSIAWKWFLFVVPSPTYTTYNTHDQNSLFTNPWNTSKTNGIENETKQNRRRVAVVNVHLHGFAALHGNGRRTDHSSVGCLQVHRLRVCSGILSRSGSGECRSILFALFPSLDTHLRNSNPSPAISHLVLWLSILFTLIVFLFFSTL